MIGTAAPCRLEQSTTDMIQPVSLRLIAHASTRAMRTGTFPDDDPLDAHGLADAASMRERFIGVPHAIALSSPALCAQQTADALGLRVRLDDALRDGGYGRWRGKRLHDLARDLPDELGAWLGDPRASPHGGESFEDVACRVGAWLDGLPPGRDVVAVTHAAIVRAAIAHALRMASQAAMRIDVAPLSCTLFVRSHDKWTVTTDDDGRDAGA
ncbi:phosphoglycerate mutase [Burkholderia anthina]|uniref:Phosphoglycerate mutase n=2 Tax=Burkholderia anthina TaxID=179879 RepID=A0A6P2GLH9_9BURK|nr:phosphoglycerate mutase [Burkholderia anthina]